MFDFIFALFPLFFLITFVIVIGTFVFTFAKGIKTWNKNNNSPRITVPAFVVTKRDHVSTHRHNHNHHHHTSYSHSYYATFQFESGDRLELAVPSDEFGLLAEGDNGKLTFQGTRFLSFERD